jgi:4'-phosphopantetheinyl transferase
MFPALEPGELHVWSARLTPREPILSADEVQRVGGFHSEIHRQRFAAARTILRSLLGNYREIAPSEVEITLGALGKPMVDGLQFNVSHADGLALFAFSLTAAVGVDLEYIRRLPDMAEMSKSCFSVAEQQALAVLPDEERDAAFFRGWTRKEAFLKATGEGIGRGLDYFTVSLDEPARLVHLDHGSSENWTLFHLTVEPGFVGAAAVQQAGTRLLSLQFCDL